ncbi:MAG TPA: glycosyltransferase family A protein [Rhizomicrobium sp.]|nr:glycosyltransferase family A protein [Rhizomicrobium sp.]
MNLTDGPLVSVVIPTWNRCRMVVEAIASVVAQTYGNWELIVVDDGSTDDTVQRLGRLEIPNLNVVRSPHIGHIGRLRNLGVNAARGEFVAFLDSDDLWSPTKLERQITALRNSSAGWSYAEYTLLSETGMAMPLRAGRAPAISGHIVRALLREETGVCPCTLIVRRSLFDAVGGFREDEKMPYRDDADIALRLARCSEAIAIPEKLALVREHPGRLTRSIAAPHEHSALVYELFHREESSAALRALARRGWAGCLANAGADRWGAGDYKGSMRLYWNALRQGGVTADWLRAAARGARNRLWRKANIAGSP